MSGRDGEADLNQKRGTVPEQLQVFRDGMGVPAGSERPVSRDVQAEARQPLGRIP